MSESSLPRRILCAIVRRTTLPLVALILIMAGRLAILGWPALTDTTESRHAVIAMQMHDTGNWITPACHFDGKLVPFWGKPPLHFWLAAAAFDLFGISEWTARLPGYLAGVAMLAITFAFARRFWGRQVAEFSTLILASSILFFTLAGSVTLDITLAASTTAAMASFANFAAATVKRSQRLWGMAFALALAIGMLVKGPIAVVLAVLSLGLWIVIARRWRLLKDYPWFAGIAVFLVVAAPWFFLAERATPGFLRYFFINEHILRYVTKDYGDLYGVGHTRPWGAAWPMLLVSFLPWTIILIRGAVGRFRRRRETSPDPYLTYALVWGVAPAVFFTFAHQLIITYLLPGFAALAVATGVALGRGTKAEPTRFSRMLFWHVVGIVLCYFGLASFAFYKNAPLTMVIVAGVCGIGLVLALLSRAWRGISQLVALHALSATIIVTVAVATFRADVDDTNSTKTIVQEVSRNPNPSRLRLVFPFYEPNSAEFYARIYLGWGIEHNVLRRENLITEKLRHASGDLLIMKRSQAKSLNPDLVARLQKVAETPTWVAYLPRQSANSPAN